MPPKQDTVTSSPDSNITTLSSTSEAYSTTSDTYIVNYLKFNGNYFAEWRTKMEEYLDDKDLLDVVEKAVPGIDSEGKIEDFKERNTETLIKKSKKAYSILIGALNNEQVQLVMHVKRPNAHRVWKILVGKHERKTQTNKIMLRRQLHGMKMKNDEKPDMYIARVNHVVQLLTSIGETVTDNEKMSVILTGLPDDWTCFVDTMATQANLEFEALGNMI